MLRSLLILVLVDLSAEHVLGVLSLWSSQCRALVEVASITMELHKFSDVELRLFKNLHLSNKNILQRKDALSLLLDFLTNGFGNELLHELSQLHLSCFVGHDL